MKAMPSQKYLCSNLLPEQCRCVHEDIKSKLERVYFVIDLWSSNDMRSLMVVKGHFIILYFLHSVMLDYRRFYGSHTGKAIHTSYQKIV